MVSLDVLLLRIVLAESYVERWKSGAILLSSMLVAYNRKCKYTLRMTKLHSGKVAAEDDFVEENEEPLADDPVLEEWHTRNALWLVTGKKRSPLLEGRSDGKSSCVIQEPARRPAAYIPVRSGLIRILLPDDSSYLGRFSGHPPPSQLRP